MAKKKVLVFTIGDTSPFCVDLLKVREIVSLPKKIHSLPKQNAWTLGTFLLREKVYPLFCLGGILSGKKGRTHSRTCVIILDIYSTDLPRCTDILGCSSSHCPGYNGAEKMCWLLEATFCGGETQGSYKEKLDNCNKCKYKIMAETYIRQVSFPVDDPWIANVDEDSLTESNNQQFYVHEGNPLAYLDVNEIIGNMGS